MLRGKLELTRDHSRDLAQARERRDRWLEKVNSGEYLPEAAGKYVVSKTLSKVEGSRGLSQARQMPLLERASAAA
jgi:hypothetical protein